MKRFVMSGLAILTVGAGMAAALPAHADPLPEEAQSILCKNVPISSWGDPKEVIDQVKDLGFEPFNIRIEKGCWEVKAHDPQGEVYEFYVHPVSKEVVLRKHKIDDLDRKPMN